MHHNYGVARKHAEVVRFYGAVHISRFKLFAYNDDCHLIDCWCVESSGMLPHRHFVCSDDDSMVIRRHAVQCDFEQSNQFIVFMEKSLQIQYDFSPCAGPNCTPLIELISFITDKIYLQKFIVIIGKW